MLNKINQLIEQYHLLKHPFYQAWMKGELTIEQLQHYALQYYPHVKDFPRFVSAVHSRCENESDRRILLENLIEEEGGPHQKNHPQLWREFAQGLGVADSAFKEADFNEKSKELASVYWKHCSSSYAEGLGALYAYEAQVPEIAKLKIEGLKARYNISEPEVLAFFSVHESADRFHSEACADLLKKLNSEDQALAIQAVESSLKSLWNFLTEVYEHRQPTQH
jgi:pyrroloquinoline-quinone synthase